MFQRPIKSPLERTTILARTDLGYHKPEILMLVMLFLDPFESVGMSASDLIELV
jgi:hypothetical protein